MSSMDPQLRKRLKHTATHNSFISRPGGYGGGTFGPPVERKCYRQGKVSVIRNAAGEEVTTSLKLYFDGLFPVSTDDTITFQNKTYQVLAYEQFDGLIEGTGTTVVYL